MKFVKIIQFYSILFNRVLKSAPACHHVAVRESGKHAPWPRSRRPDRSNPEPKRRADRSHRDALVVELTGYLCLF